MKLLIIILSNLHFRAINSFDSFRRSNSFNDCSVLLGSSANEAKMVLIFIFMDFNLNFKKIVSVKLFFFIYMTLRKNRSSMIEQHTLEPLQKRTGKKKLN